MRRRFVRRSIPFLLALGLAAGPSLGRAQSPAPTPPPSSPAAAAPAAPELDVVGEHSDYNYQSGEMVVTGHARLVARDVTLTADELRYNRQTKLAAARGHVVLTRGDQRLVADEGTYNTETRAVTAKNLRVGQFPAFLNAASATGTVDELVFHDATVFFRTNASYAPSVRAKQLTYRDGRIVSGVGARIGLLAARFLTLPHVEADLDSEVFRSLTADVGFRRDLGVFVEGGFRLPVADGLKLGALGGLYSQRGLMLGPAASLQRRSDDGVSFVDSVLTSGYIRDSGRRLTDIVGDPVRKDRGYVKWDHRQQLGERLTINGQFQWWRDSEIIRDFDHKKFFADQQPDSYLEAAYAADHSILSVFGRFHPNRFHRAQERLPEIRFDLLPVAAPLGAYQRLAASFAYLQEDTLRPTLQQTSTRLDAYYGLERPLAPTPWLTFTPVADARVTYYDRTNGGRDNYTRTLGEVGFDANLRASGTFDYRNERWGINGLRHLIEPRLSYRYSPQAESGRRYIPPIDRRVFDTQLRPLSLADTRNVDDLERLDTLRIALRNTLQTRDATYGSRDLATFNVALDRRFSRSAGQRQTSDVHTDLSFTPAAWLRIELYERFTPQTAEQKELNYAITISDQDWWSARLSSHFQKGEYEEYWLDYRRRLNEVFEFVGNWQYDTVHSRFNEQSYGLRHRLGQTWAIDYEISFHQGPRRESSLGVSIGVELLKF